MGHETRQILVVDDHVEMAELLADMLADHALSVRVASSGSEAIAIIDSSPPDVVITDLRMEDVDGFDVLDHAQQSDPKIPVLVMTAFGDIDSAVEAMKRGAEHYLTKPFKLDEVLVNVQRALEIQEIVVENRSLRQMVIDHGSLQAIIGESAPIAALRERIRRVAGAAMPTLIEGESGSGKELVAQAIHYCSSRARQPFVAVNCSSLPANLLESEFFGHARGAFTGADRSRRGLFVEADGGTLFLDEVGDMPLELQAKLLRVLEDRTIRPVGSDETRTVDVRIVAATNRGLAEQVRDGAMREDLFFRLNVLPVAVPPLRDRDGDIPLLVDHFVAQARAEHPSATAERFSPGAIARLEAQLWPGNVRQLANLVRRLVVLHPGPVVDEKSLATELNQLADGVFEIRRTSSELLSLRELEDSYIEWVIEQCDGNKTQAARVLDIDPSTIHRRQKK